MECRVMFVLIWGKIYLTFVLFPSNNSFPVHNFGEIHLGQISSQLFEWPWAHSNVKCFEEILDNVCPSCPWILCWLSLLADRRAPLNNRTLGNAIISINSRDAISIIWTESNCYAMLFLMDQMSLEKELLKFFQNWYFVFKKRDFSRPSSLSFKLQLLFCVFFPLVNKDFPLILLEMDKEPEQMCTKGSIVLWGSMTCQTLSPARLSPDLQRQLAT